MTRWKPSRYSPTPGTERCALCREMEGPDHVSHPWTQVVGWLWDDSPLWRVWIIAFGAIGTMTLAAFIAAARILLTGS